MVLLSLLISSEDTDSRTSLLGLTEYSLTAGCPMKDDYWCLYLYSVSDLGMFVLGSHQIQAVFAVQSQEPGDWRRISALNVKCFTCFVSWLFHPSFPKQRSSTKWWKHSPCRAERGRVPGGCSWSDPGLSWLGSGWRWCCAFWCSWGFEDVLRSHTVSLIVYILKN